MPKTSRSPRMLILTTSLSWPKVWSSEMTAAESLQGFVRLCLLKRRGIHMRLAAPMWFWGRFGDCVSCWDWERVHNSVRLVVSTNIFFLHPENWGRFPFWRAYSFLKWVEPTNQWSHELVLKNAVFSLTGQTWPRSRLIRWAQKGQGVVTKLYGSWRYRDLKIGS